MMICLSRSNGHVSLLLSVLIQFLFTLSLTTSTVTSADYIINRSRMASNLDNHELTMSEHFNSSLLDLRTRELTLDNTYETLRVKCMKTESYCIIMADLANEENRNTRFTHVYLIPDIDYTQSMLVSNKQPLMLSKSKSNEYFVFQARSDVMTNDPSDYSFQLDNLYIDETHSNRLVFTDKTNKCIYAYSQDENSDNQLAFKRIALNFQPDLVKFASAKNQLISLSSDMCLWTSNDFGSYWTKINSGISKLDLQSNRDSFHIHSNSTFYLRRSLDADNVHDLIRYDLNSNLEFIVQTNVLGFDFDEIDSIILTLTKTGSKNSLHLIDINQIDSIITFAGSFSQKYQSEIQIDKLLEFKVAFSAYKDEVILHLITSANSSSGILILIKPQALKFEVYKTNLANPETTNSKIGAHIMNEWKNHYFLLNTVESSTVFNTDKGFSWTQIKTMDQTDELEFESLLNTNEQVNGHFVTMRLSQTRNLFASNLARTHVYTSRNYGQEWKAISLPGQIGFFHHAYAEISNTLLAAVEHSVLVSFDLGTTWLLVKVMNNSDYKTIGLVYNELRDVFIVFMYNEKNNSWKTVEMKFCAKNKCGVVEPDNYTKANTSLSQTSMSLTQTSTPTAQTNTSLSHLNETIVTSSSNEWCQTEQKCIIMGVVALVLLLIILFSLVLVIFLCVKKISWCRSEKKKYNPNLLDEIKSNNKQANQMPSSAYGKCQQKDHIHLECYENEYQSSQLKRQVSNLKTILKWFRSFSDNHVEDRCPLI